MRRFPPYAKDGLGILSYLLLLGILYRFDWMAMFQPLPLGSVLGGAIILTLSQWKKGTPLHMVLENIRRNAFLAGLLTGLLQLLSLLSTAREVPVTTHILANQLLPVLYGCFFVLPWGNRHASPDSGEETVSSQETALAEQAEVPAQKHTITIAAPLYPLFKEYGFTPRECHVALKVLDDTSNREIAESLYISETTVKKHIQNMFRKCGATDRRSFRKLFIQ